jgi:hypothetical protein
MSKKHQKTIKRMTSLLRRIMEVTHDKHPITVCAVCCAVIAIMHRRMNDDDAEAVRPLVEQCLRSLAEDPAQTGKRVH